MRLIADIFLEIFNYFFGQAISQNSSKPLIVKGFLWLEWQMIIAFEELREENCRSLIEEILQLF